jgi:hypothetical protein
VIVVCLIKHIPHCTREFLVVCWFVHPDRGPTQATQIGFRCSVIIAGDNHHRQLWNATAQKANNALTSKFPEKLKVNNSNNKRLVRQCLCLGLGMRDYRSKALSRKQILGGESEQRFVFHDEGQWCPSVSFACGGHGQSP